MRTIRHQINVRIPLIYLAVFTLLVGSCLVCQNPRAGEPGLKSVDINHPPGKRVDIGGYKLHIYCVGQGSPTVVLESGIGGFSLEWVDVQAALARQMRVCAYDRAGYGWSERSPLPRTARVMARELHKLLTRAGVPGPYLLVGHSFGGYIIRYYAVEHPQEVSGLVLIDASHPEQFKYFPKAPAVNNSQRDYPRSYTIHVIKPAYPAKYPQRVRNLAYMLMVRNRSVEVQLEEVNHFEESGRQLVELGGRLPDIPVTVLSRGSRVWPNTQYGDAMEIAWKYLQNDLAHLTLHTSHLVVADSGHAIHLDQARAVTDSIMDNVQTAYWLAARSNLVAGVTSESGFLNTRPLSRQ